MKRFINPKTRNYHHGAVEDFSDTSKFLTSGLAKGHNTTEYSWVADMLFKNTGNLSLNPHITRLSFFSDREIMYQQFGNISDIYDAYPFFSDWERSILSELNVELDTKQYYKIGQRYSEFDLIEYINLSELITDPTDGYLVYHKFYRAPVFHAEGYKLNLDTNDEYVSFDKYIWAIPSLTKFNVGEYHSELDLYSGSAPDDLTTENTTVYEAYTGTHEKILDYKIHADNPKYGFYDIGVLEWVLYHNDTVHYQANSFNPYYGIVSIYTGDGWVEDPPAEGPPTYGVNFFPEIIINGVLEPAKITLQRSASEAESKGRMAFNPGCHYEDSKDQSRIIYNVCVNMFTDDGYLEWFLRREIDGFTVFDGVEINTERNRRYSATVMTEPYFVTVPLGSGQLVEYSFVDKDGNEVYGSSTRERFLKIKSSLNIFSEIDSELRLNNYNTDIINVLTIRDFDPVANDINSTALNFYDKFKDTGDADVFYDRQEACLDDLTEGIIGTGVYRKFYMDAAWGADADKYSDDEMKVCGLGVTWRTVDSVAKIDLNIYCTNYVAINSPPDGVVETPIANTNVEFLPNPESHITAYSGPERFKPMIKIPEMNGYVKIMSKNKDFSVTRSNDGKYEMVYNIEFPYCPGSLNVRDEDLGVMSGFIYKMKSYINAGSQETEPANSRYDAGNDRYAPYGDDSFCKIDVLMNPRTISGFTSTDPFSKGGGTQNLESVEEKQIRYPNSIVWTSNEERTDLFTLTKPRFSDFRRYGSFEFGFTGVRPLTDMKMFCLVDNRQWKFNEDQFVSYIGRENPSYVFEIDASELFEDFTKFQALHGPIPDTKRWLYGYFTGFAHVISSQDLDISSTNTEKIETIHNTTDLSSNESKSDITVEIWDQESDVGNSQTGNWRPFISLSGDNHKIPGSIIADNIIITDIGSVSEDDPESEFADIYSAYISYMDTDESGIFNFKFPDSINYGEDDDVLDGKSNLVFYDTINKKSFHVAYIKRVNDPLYVVDSEQAPQQIYKIYVKADSVDDFDTVDVEDIEIGVEAQYQIRYPFKTITKNPRFSTSTIRAVDGIDLGFLTNFLDLKAVGSPHSDYERFLVSNKIYFRVRVVKGGDYSSSYLSRDYNVIPYVGEDVGDDSLAADRVDLNFPWYSAPGGSIETAFDWTKIKIGETIRKFGLNYFKCASK